MPPTLSRRRLLQLLALAHASAAFPGLLRADAGSELYDDGNREVPDGAVGDPERVIVVGAGWAGLSAANALRHAGVEVVVVEARDRLGGRAWTRDVGGVPVDLGGSWIHTPVGNPMARFADQVGVGRVPADPFPGISGFDALTGWIPGGEFASALVQTVLFEAAVPGLSARLGPEASVAEAIGRYLAEVPELESDPDLRRRAAFGIRLLAEQFSSRPAEDLPLAWYLNAGIVYGGNENGDFPVGGYRRLVDAMAEGLDIRLGEVVTHVEARRHGVRVETVGRRAWGRRLDARGGHGPGHGREIHRGSHVLVTVPLGVLRAGRPRFVPELPAHKRDAIARLGFGNFEKVALRFETPFWRETRRGSFVYLSRTPLEFPIFLDLFGFVGEPVLVALCSDGFAERTLRTSRRRIRERVLEILEELFGRGVPEPLDVAVTRWGRDPFTRGAYSDLALGTTPAAFDVLAEPVAGRVLFAGEATSRDRFGFTDGALSTGVREAKRLLRLPAVQLGALS